MSFTSSDFSALSDVSRETFDAFSQWGALLEKWNPRINLVAPSTLNDFWFRHAFDSWQVARLLPEKTESVLDLGSGAGFPGLALAIALKERGTGQVTLVESVGKKANFMKTVTRELDLPAKVENRRVEALPTNKYDVISARAFAPMDRLLDYCAPFWAKQTLGLFPKGRDYQAEIEKAKSKWVFDVQTTPSVTDEDAVILRVSGLTKKT